jgi:DNA excision repair protein ERCC-3
MTDRSRNPLIVQSDHTILADVSSPRFDEARNALLRFAELVKSPEHVHTYRITPLSIWNACATGVASSEIAEALEEYSRFPVPANVLAEVGEYAGRYGLIELETDGKRLRLRIADAALALEILRLPGVGALVGERIGDHTFSVAESDRGRLKRALTRAGFPVRDLAGYNPGELLSLELREIARSGEAFELRGYQREAAEAFYRAGSAVGGSGVVVLPCGAGKTIVGIAAMAAARTSTLILTTSITASRQWIAEIRDKSTLEADCIGEYDGAKKEVRPVTVATYQVLTHRTPGTEELPHFRLFERRNWGLIIYDEVHLLPAPVFQITAELQARRRLGLTATLVREDGREDDVFALIGPKKADVPWKVLEGQGWIAKARCAELRIPLSPERRVAYAVAPVRQKPRLAADNPAKSSLVKQILADHGDQPALVIGTYLDQLRAIADELAVPLLTGATPQRRRDRLYADFRAGRLPAVVVSKVANFAVDLPEASLAIQVSGSFGSRQEEAQRLGRLLRPKPGRNQAHFYSLVSRDTVEQDFAMKRQLFLCEQGYVYEIRDVGEPARGPDETLGGHA